jgi:hypothetical protein
MDPLTEDEARWVRSLERILLRAPSRLELLTIGDRGLSVVDRDGARLSTLCDGAARDDGIVLADIRSRCIIHGVSG